MAAVASSICIDETDYTAEICFAEGLRVFKESKMEGHQEHTLKAWAEYELKHGDRAKGETLWQEAREIFDRLEMPLLVEWKK